MSSSFDFVIADIDSSGRSKAADRTIIRSRCMRGKNKRAGSRRSLRETRRNGSAISGSTGANSVAILACAPSGYFDLIQLADNVGPKSREMLFKIFTCNTLTHAMSPLMSCVEFPVVETGCFHWLFSDVAFLHALLLASSMMNDFAAYKQQQPGKKTYFHLRKTISLLNQGLSESEAHWKDSTLYVVIMLATLAAVCGDWRAADAHLSGVQKIVQLRGGWAYLKQRPKMHFKLDRIVLYCALVSGHAPHFLSDAESLDPIHSTHKVSFEPSLERFPIEGHVDSRLVPVFHDLQTLTHTLNEHVHARARWNVDSFQNLLNSIQSRLLQLADQLRDSVSECLRLSMLALLTTTFKFPGRQLKYSFVADSFRKLFVSIEDDTAQQKDTLVFWALMVGAISVLDIEEKWLREGLSGIIQRQSLLWEEAKRRLMSVMWIECIHDEPGERIFHELATYRTSQQSSNP